MVKKETIGKIQLILGIVLLLGAIIGGIYSYSIINDQMEGRIWSLGGNNPFQGAEFSSNETKLSITLDYTSLQYQIVMGYTNMIINLECSAVIIALLSIMLILQGLANIGDKR